MGLFEIEFEPIHMVVVIVAVGGCLRYLSGTIHQPVYEKDVLVQPA